MLRADAFDGFDLRYGDSPRVLGDVPLEPTLGGAKKSRRAADRFLRRRQTLAALT
jgi:hypothetical protein